MERPRKIYDIFCNCRVCRGDIKAVVPRTDKLKPAPPGHRCIYKAVRGAAQGGLWAERGSERVCSVCNRSMKWSSQGTAFGQSPLVPAFEDHHRELWGDEEGTPKAAAPPPKLRGARPDPWRRFAAGIVRLAAQKPGYRKKPNPWRRLAVEILRLAAQKPGCGKQFWVGGAVDRPKRSADFARSERLALHAERMETFDAYKEVSGDPELGPPMREMLEDLAKRIAELEKLEAPLAARFRTCGVRGEKCPDCATEIPMSSQKQFFAELDVNPALRRFYEVAYIGRPVEEGFAPRGDAWEDD